MDLEQKFTYAIQKNRLSHALLFTGIDSAFKEDIASKLLSSLFCEKEQIPFGCGQCLSCTMARNKKHPKIRRLLLEDGVQEIKIAQVRDLITTPGNPSWIIPEVHLLNKQASNALLKTLEEPRGDQRFILIAPHESLILPTLVSRCQRVYFPKKPGLENAEPVEIPKTNLEKIDLIEKLSKSKEKLPEIFRSWGQNSSDEFKEALLQAEKDLKRHGNAQLILESLLLSKKP